MKKQALKAQVQGKAPIVEVKPHGHLKVRTGVKAGSNQHSKGWGLGKDY
jgi:hypothetical protein